MTFRPTGRMGNVKTLNCEGCGQEIDRELKPDNKRFCSKDCYDNDQVNTKSQGWQCELDDLPIAEHLQCAACSILVGPGHIETEVDEDGWCEDCGGVFRRRQRRRKERAYAQ